MDFHQQAIDGHALGMWMIRQVLALLPEDLQILALLPQLPSRRLAEAVAPTSLGWDFVAWLILQVDDVLSQIPSPIVVLPKSHLFGWDFRNLVHSFLDHFLHLYKTVSRLCKQ